MVAVRAGLVAGVLLLTPAWVAAQEELPEAAEPDSAVSDLPGELVGVLADTAGPGTLVVFPPPLSVEPRAGDVTVWDRARIRRSNASSLFELVAEMLPGALPLRAGFFGGPHHLVDGPFGAAAVDLRIDGRNVVPMIGAQPDLSSVPLGSIDGVVVRRGASRIMVDVTTVRRTGPQAYSRVEAGTGDPGLEELRLVFTNGFGSKFALSSGFDLLDTGGDFPADRQAFFSSLAWIPGDGRTGVELQYHGGSFGRSVGAGEIGSRSRLVLGGRLGVSERVDVSAWIGESRRKLDANPDLGVEAGRDVSADAGLEVQASLGDLWLRAGSRGYDHPDLPSLVFDVGAGGHLLSWLTAEASGTLGSWDAFATREATVALAADLPLTGTRIVAEGSTGNRGMPYIASDSAGADSTSFRAVSALLEWRSGRMRLAGRIGNQRIDRQFAFGTGFDFAGTAEPRASVTSFELQLDAPVIPLGWLIDGMGPVRAAGTYRRNEVNSSSLPLYVPVNALRGEMFLHDEFLEGDLELRIGIGLERRDGWLAPSSPVSGITSPTAVPAVTSWDFDLALRIVGMIIFWRFDNMAGTLQRDLPGFDFPIRRSSFGIRWEFLD